MIDAYKCPKCGSQDLRVEVKVVTTLLQEDGNIQTIDDDARSEHCWDSDSAMLCATCDHSAPALDFEVRDAAPPGGR